MLLISLLKFKNLYRLCIEKGKVVLNQRERRRFALTSEALAADQVSEQQARGQHTRAHTLTQRLNNVTFNSPMPLFSHKQTSIYVLAIHALFLTFFWSLHRWPNLASRRLAAVAHCCASRRIRRFMKLRDSFPAPMWSKSTDRSVRKAACSAKQIRSKSNGLTRGENCK